MTYTVYFSVLVGSLTLGYLVGRFYRYPRKHYKNKAINWLRQLL